MSRIEGNSSQIPVETHEEHEVENKPEKKVEDAVRTRIDKRAVEVEEYNAHKNDASQSPDSRFAEVALKTTLDTMKPGTKLRVSGECKVGEGFKVGGTGSFEIEKLEHGYRLTAVAGASVGAGKELGHVIEGELGIKGAVSASWDFATSDLAADSTVAIAERFSANPFTGVNAENDRQVRQLVARPSALTVEVGAEAELSADAGFAEAGITAGGKTRVTYDFFNKTAVSETALESEAHGTFGGGGEVGGVSVFGRTEFGRVESKVALKNEFKVNPRAWQELDRTGDLAAFSKVVAQSPREMSVVQEVSVAVANHTAALKHETPIKSAADLKNLADPLTLEGEWTEKGPRTETGFEFDAEVIRAGMKLELDPPPVAKHHGTGEDVLKAFAERSDAEKSLRTQRYIHAGQ